RLAPRIEVGRISGKTIAQRAGCTRLGDEDADEQHGHQDGQLDNGWTSSHGVTPLYVVCLASFRDFFRDVSASGLCRVPGFSGVSTPIVGRGGPSPEVRGGALAAWKNASWAYRICSAAAPRAARTSPR